MEGVKKLFCLYAEKTKLRQREPNTSGSVNVYSVRFAFSAEWDGLSRTAVFKAGADGEPVSVLLDASSECTIPWEILTEKGPLLMAGVYGTDASGEIVLPTIWVSLGQILGGAKPGKDAQPPTPDLWQQALAAKADSLNYTPDGDLGLYAGDALLSAVPVASGGGEGGVTDHRLLKGRDAPEQHPITSIKGLPEELERIPEPAEALTNEDLEELLK